MATNSIRIRNDWDRQITESVLVLDEYRLQALYDTGLKVHWALDIGSHIGSFARMVKQLWPDSQVICVEPDPTAEPYWQYNTRELAGLHWHPTAIVPVGGPATVHLMHSADHNAAANFTSEIVQEFTPIPADREFDEVSAVDILSLLAGHGNPELDLVKLDCEGAEVHILEDLQDAGYLSKIHQICGEWHYFESIPRIEAALRASHQLSLYRHEHPWGAFFACRMS